MQLYNRTHSALNRVGYDEHLRQNKSSPTLARFNVFMSSSVSCKVEITDHSVSINHHQLNQDQLVDQLTTNSQFKTTKRVLSKRQIMANVGYKHFVKITYFELEHVSVT